MGRAIKDGKGSGKRKGYRGKGVSKERENIAPPL